MGKLHKLRRAIERDPEAFWPDCIGCPLGARRVDGKWLPNWATNSYRRFVEHVFTQIPRGRQRR